ncbi:MAG: DUF6597 domain-containing transcriptional factor [Steroidobacteraceae bacterium]
MNSISLIHRVTRRPLHEFVDFVWLSENYVRPHATERVLATGTAGLILNLDARAQAAADILSGARTRSFVLDTSKPLSLIGVNFRPGGSFPFSGGSAAESENLSVPLDALWGRGALVLREQLLEAASPAAKFEVLEHFLSTQLIRCQARRHPAVRYAIDAFQTNSEALSVGSVVDRVGLSARRFIELFRREVGMTPKLFCRVARFRAVVTALESAAPVDWAATAALSGYFDQAHFIHDFRAFAGVTPAAYIARRTASPNHVRIGQ